MIMVHTFTTNWKGKDKMTEYGGTLEERYENYLTWADDGRGGDNTRNGEPLLTFDEWLNN
jgi:hypothetical protein|tara:strand:+ start:59 stop:238 length:180 start_codon:yes stop_codon:yes gene_type:complete